MQAAARTSQPPAAADVVIVGGGINGISAFRDLALNGVHAVVLERDDFCSGASAALSRMVHGGLRYLENGEVRLVRESLAERDRLLRNAPHVVFPLPTVVPLTSWTKGALPVAAGVLTGRTAGGPRPGLMVRLGLVLYDLLSWRHRALPRHRALSRAALRRLVPGVTSEAVGGVLYHDARVTLPERLGVEMVLDVEAETPSRAFNHLELAGRDGDALLWRDRLTGATGRIVPRLVVNATGAWADRVEAVLRPGANRPRVQGTKGSHLVIRNAALQAALGERMIYFANADGRICIAFNHLGAALVGSTDIRVDDPDAAVCEADERDYILAALNGVLPDLAVREEEIVHVFTGVRPLPVGEAGATARISRDHFVEADEAGTRGLPWPVLTLIGGKWTTFRAFGEEVADAALARLGRVRVQSTRDLAIGGGRGMPAADRRGTWLAAEGQASGLPPARFEALLARYGTRASALARFILEGEDAPLATAPDHSRRELVWIARNEHVRDLADLLMRRTTLGIEGRVTEPLMAEVSTLVAPELGWDEAAAAAAVQRLRVVLERRHRVQPRPA